MSTWYRAFLFFGRLRNMGIVPELNSKWFLSELDSVSKNKLMNSMTELLIAAGEGEPGP